MAAGVRPKVEGACQQSAWHAGVRPVHGMHWLLGGVVAEGATQPPPLAGSPLAHTAPPTCTGRCWPKGCKSPAAARASSPRTCTPVCLKNSRQGAHTHHAHNRQPPPHPEATPALHTQLLTYTHRHRGQGQHASMHKTVPRGRGIPGVISIDPSRRHTGCTQGG